jgi:predicted amidohydrolase
VTGGCRQARDPWERAEPASNLRALLLSPGKRAIRIVAIQLQPALGAVAENLRRRRASGDEAGAAGAEWIILHEFFAAGMGFLDAPADAALPPDGAATQLLRELATRHHAVVGGSFICRDSDGENRNAWFLVATDGRVLGRHDKDIPTM